MKQWTAAHGAGGEEHTVGKGRDAVLGRLGGFLEEENSQERQVQTYNSPQAKEDIIASNHTKSKSV